MPATQQSARGLVDDRLFNELAGDVRQRQDVDQAMAERIVEQALAFLAACSDNPRQHLSPSKAVDAGWHAFLARPKRYAAWCRHTLGRHVHHEAYDWRSSGGGAAALALTVERIQAAGYTVDAELWRPEAGVADCAHTCRDGDPQPPPR